MLPVWVLAADRRAQGQEAAVAQRVGGLAALIEVPRRLARGKVRARGVRRGGDELLRMNQGAAAQKA